MTEAEKDRMTNWQEALAEQGRLGVLAADAVMTELAKMLAYAFPTQDNRLEEADRHELAQ